MANIHTKVEAYKDKVTITKKSNRTLGRKPKTFKSDMTKLNLIPSGNGYMLSVVSKGQHENEGDFLINQIRLDRDSLDEFKDAIEIILAR